MTGRTPTARRPWVRPVVACTALALLALAFTLPIWVAKLEAPQYPKGLWLIAYGDRIAGDVFEVNELNHYIGMQTIDPRLIPELVLWPLAPLSAAACALFGLFARGIVAALARLVLWVIPIVVLVDIQRWLAIYGRDLSHDAALRLQPFVPLALGPTTVWNFRIWALPGPALVILVLVAAAVTLVARGGRPSPRARGGLGVAATLLLLGGCAAPAAAPADPHAGHATAPVVSGARSSPMPILPAPGAVAAGDLAGLIAATPAGGELRIPAGTYRGPVTIDRPMTVAAVGRVVVDGGGHGTVLTIRAPSVVVRGLEIHGSGGQVEDAAGIAVLGDDARIEGNHLEHVYVGILARGARDVRIVDNTVLGPGYVETQTGLFAAHHDARTAMGDGISLWDVEGALVRGNRVRGMRDGVYLSFSDDVLVDRNEVSGSRYAVHTMFGRGLTIFENAIAENASGLVLMSSSEVTVARNHLTDQRSAATGYAVLLKDVVGVRLVENVALRNGVAVRAEGTDRTQAPAEVLLNDFSYNTVGLQLLPSSRLVFSRNTLVDNVVQVDLPGAVTAGAHQWTKTGLGNFWGDYVGFDRDGNGAGDLPHRVGTATAQLYETVPEMLLFRGSLATALLARAERSWELGRATTVVDPLPLVGQLSPRPAQRDAGSPAGWVLAGIALVGAAAGGVRAAARARVR